MKGAREGRRKGRREGRREEFKPYRNVRGRKQKPSGIPPSRFTAGRSFPPEPFQSSSMQLFPHKVPSPLGGIYSD